MPEGDIWNLKISYLPKMLTITLETPIAALTVGQFRELFFTAPKFEKSQPQPENPIFGIDVCAKETGYSKSAIYARTSKGLIPCFRRDGKLLFRREEIMNWLTENRVVTQKEFSNDLDSKLTKRRGGRA